MFFGNGRRDPAAPLFSPRDEPAGGPPLTAAPPDIMIDPPRPEPGATDMPPDVPPPAPPPPPVPVALAPLVPAGAAAPARPASLVSLLPDLPPPLPLPPTPPAASPNPRFASFAACADLRAGAIMVAQPAFWGGQSLRLVVAPPMMRREPTPLLDGTSGFTNEYVRAWHREQRPLPAPELACQFVADAIVTGPGHVWVAGALVTAPEIMPAYVRALHNIPADGAALLAAHALPLREIAAPCVVLAGHGVHVYGNFLIEMLPRVLLMRRVLAGSGLAVRWLLDAAAPDWMLRILHDDLGIPPADIEMFRPTAERVRLRHAILPGLPRDEHGFHPYADLLVEDLLASLAPLPHVERTPLLFVAQRACRNEAALSALAEARGFVVVEAEAMPWRQQLALFRQAEMVVGTYGSALHTALVCPPGTRVGAVGLLNPTQSEIATLRGHRMAYLTNGFALEGQFTVPEDAFAAFLDALCHPAAAARAA